MAPTPQDVQAKLDQATSHFKAATSTYSQMVKKYGNDWTRWPANTHWFQGLTLQAAARAETGQLITPVLTADFAYEED